MSTFTHEMPTKHSARRRGRFIAPVSLYYQIYIFISPNTHFRFIIHEYSHYQICVSIPHFVGVYVYAGTINRSLRLLTDCDNVANIPRNAHENTRNTQRTPTKCPTKHTVRRRGPIHRARILTLSNIHIRFTKYTFPFHYTRVFTLSNMRFRSSFCGCLRICGHDKSVPYSC